jgi:hypothetical protein
MRRGSKANIQPKPKTGKSGFARRFFGMAVFYLVVALDFSGSLSPAAADAPADAPTGMRKCVRTMLGGKDIRPTRICGREIIISRQGVRNPA